MADRLIVTVTADDVAEGLAADCTLCPIALAIKRETGVAAVWVTGQGAICLGWDGDPPQLFESDYLPADERAADFIEWFDEADLDPDTGELAGPGAEFQPLTLEFVAAGGAA